MSALSRFKMQVARGFFLAMFTVVMVYIPFYFGGNAIVAFFTPVFKDQAVAEIFVKYMNSVLTAPFFLFKSVTLGIAIFSLLLLVALLIATVSLTVEVVKLVKRRRKDIEKRRKDEKVVLCAASVFVCDFRFLYKRLERYLN